MRPCKEVAPDKTTRPGCLSLSFARPLQTLRVIAPVWPVLETGTEWLQAAYDGCGHSGDTIKTHFYSFPKSQFKMSFLHDGGEGGVCLFGQCVKPSHSPEISQSTPSIQLY